MCEEANHALSEKRKIDELRKNKIKNIHSLKCLGVCFRLTFPPDRQTKTLSPFSIILNSSNAATVCLNNRLGGDTNSKCFVVVANDCFGFLLGSGCKHWGRDCAFPPCGSTGVGFRFFFC